MKKTYITTILIAAAAMIAFTGCGKTNPDVSNYKEPEVSSEPTDDPEKDPKKDYEKDPKVDADAMSITSEEGKELIVMRVKDDYLELTNECESVFCLETAEYPDMKDGSIIRMIADVDIYDGGEAGYMRNSFLKKVIETEPLDYAETVSKLGIPDLLGNEFKYGQHVLQYAMDDNLYFAVLSRGEIILYQNGEPVYKYEYSAEEDIMEPLYAYLAACTYEAPADGSQVKLALNEEEILDLDVIHLRGYGDLLAKGLLADESTPNDLRGFFNVGGEKGYIGIGRYAGKSADSEAQAREIAESFWVGSTAISYDNIQYIGENAELWLYQADYSINGEFKAIDTLIVYKKDYYDAEQKKAGFALDEENIRHFFATQNMEPAEKTCCIGEFVTEDGGEFSFRRYDMQVTDVENDDAKKTMQIFETEYNITADGQITQTDHFEPLYEITLTVEVDGVSEEQAVSAVREYCYANNPELKSIEEAGEYPVYWEIESSDEKEIVVLFRSYTGVLVRYYIDRNTGDASITEFVPGITEEETPTGEGMNIWDYISQ